MQIEAKQIQDDLDLLEASQRRFWNAAQKAKRCRDRLAAAEAFRLAEFFGRVGNIYRQARSSGSLPLAFETDDVLEIGANDNN